MCAPGLQHGAAPACKRRRRLGAQLDFCLLHSCTRAGRGPAPNHVCAPLLRMAWRHPTSFQTPCAATRQVADLLEASKGEVGDFSAAAPAVLAERGDPMGGLLLQLPAPWPPGADMVRLIGVVAQRRRCVWQEPKGKGVTASSRLLGGGRLPALRPPCPHSAPSDHTSASPLAHHPSLLHGHVARCPDAARSIAKLLLFVSLVPEAVPELPRDGTAAYLRRLWRHPEQAGRAAEVQLICGKTLERSLVRAWACHQAASTLMLRCPAPCCPALARPCDTVHRCRTRAAP